MKIPLTILMTTSLLFGQTIEEPSSFAPLPNPKPIETELPPILFAPSPKSTFLAVGLSTLFPGLGHLYLNENKVAGGLIGSASAGLGLAIFSFPSYEISTTSLITFESIWSYGIYAAYRDVRSYNGSSRYSYQMPTDSFADLSLSPIRARILKKPEVWGGFLGALALAIGTSYWIYPEEAHIRLSTERSIPTPLIALPVGIGEEALFRGYLQSLLSESFNPWVGITLSSLAFGAAHIPNAQMLEKEHRWRYYSFSLPLITTLGAYFGWMTYKNRSLQESVALHTWYDFTLFAASAFARQAAATGRPGFAMSLPF
jgi:membrane protease YdiL (CAAX protease family)